MLSKKIIKRLYYQLLRLRMIEESIAVEYNNQEMRCPVHLYIGEEAIGAGVGENLRKEDKVFSAHRSHGHFLIKGGNLNRMMAEIYGKATGCTLGRGGSQHLIDLSVNFSGATPIVGETIPLAVGSALAQKMLKKSGISVVFMGEAATEEGIFHESLNFASLKKLPVLFVVENNFYSICTPLSERQPKRGVFKLGLAQNIRSYQGDGNDVLEVYQMAKKAVSYIRKGEGPVLLEFLTYRVREHCGPNFEPDGFRPKAEYNLWMKKDPLKKFDKYTNAHKLLRREETEKMKNIINKEIAKAFDFAKESPFPAEELSMDQVYA